MSFLFLEHNRKAKSEHLRRCRGTKLCTPLRTGTSCTTKGGRISTTARRSLQPGGAPTRNEAGRGGALPVSALPAGGRSSKSRSCPWASFPARHRRGSARAAAPARRGGGRTPRASPHSPATRRPPGRAAERSGLPPPEKAPPATRSPQRPRSPLPGSPRPLTLGRAAGLGQVPEQVHPPRPARRRPPRRRAPPLPIRLAGRGVAA